MQKTSRLPEGNKIIVPIDTNIINALVELENLLGSSIKEIETFNPLSINDEIFTDHTNMSTTEIESLHKTKLVIFSLYRSFIEKTAIPFISPTVLNEILNIDDKHKEFKNQCLEFIDKYALTPAIEYDEENKPHLVGEVEAEELAHKYCEPYDYTYFNKTTREVQEEHSNYGAMKWDANPHALGSHNSSKRPHADAFVMAYAAIYRLSLLTLNSCDFIHDRPGDNIRRNGIVSINRQYLNVDYKHAPAPYHPTDIYEAIRASKNYATNKTDLSPFDQKEFLRILEIKFGHLDIYFTSQASKVLEIMNINISDSPLPSYPEDEEIVETPL